LLGCRGCGQLFGLRRNHGDRGEIRWKRIRRGIAVRRVGNGDLGRRVGERDGGDGLGFRRGRGCGSDGGGDGRRAVQFDEVGVEGRLGIAEEVAPVVAEFGRRAVELSLLLGGEGWEFVAHVAEE